eukprot:symbB.v1.2.007005.t1/scaffold385.1/size305797/1
MEPFRRKARVKETLSSAHTTEIGDADSGSDSARSDLADCGEGNGRSRRRWSDQRLNDMLQRDWSPISSPRVSASKKKSAAKGQPSDDLENKKFQPELLEWHPSVQSLLASVSTGSQRMRSTLRQLPRCQSEPKVSPLPAVKSASPQRGGLKASKSIPDFRKNEGWRAKVGSAAPDVGSICGETLFRKEELPD